MITIFFLSSSDEKKHGNYQNRLTETIGEDGFMFKAQIYIQNRFNGAFFF